jgi:CheY-like chemotaxis protein
LIARVQPTVILLDHALPYRSGASWLAQLKSDPATAEIPVVILSELPDMLPRERRELAAAVIRKPFRPGALLETVRTVCAGAALVEAEVRTDRASSPRQESP